MEAWMEAKQNCLGYNHKRRHKIYHSDDPVLFHSNYATAQLYFVPLTNSSTLLHAFYPTS